MKRHLKNKKGFTLIELIVVIAILGILALIAIPRLAGFQEDARKQADVSNGKTIASIVSILVANQDIKADVTRGEVSVADSPKIAENLPNGVPKLQTTVANTGYEFYYSVDVDTGAVTVWGAADNTAANCDGDHELYPDPGSVFK